MTSIRVNNFYKVLFNPGFPVQARELTFTINITNQIEDFGVIYSKMVQ